MFACTLRQNLRISAAQLEVCARRAITIAEHVEDRNTAAKVLRSGGGIASRHVQHSVQTMRLASETQVGSRVGGFLGDSLQFRGAFVEFAGLEMGFSGDQP